VIEHVANSSFFKSTSHVSQQYHWYQQETFTPPRAYEFGGGSSGTAQVTISRKFDGIRANLMAGAAEPMPL